MPIDPIIARAQQALAASLREAYYAGRGDAALSLKEKVLALVEELIAVPHEAGFAPAPAAPSPPHEPAPAAPPAAAEATHESHAAEASPH